MQSCGCRDCHISCQVIISFLDICMIRCMQLLLVILRITFEHIWHELMDVHHVWAIIWLWWARTCRSLGVRGGEGGGVGGCSPPPPRFFSNSHIPAKKSGNIRAKPLDFRASNGQNIRATDLSPPKRNWSRTPVCRTCSTAVSFALKSEVDNVEDVGAQKVQDRK